MDSLLPGIAPPAPYQTALHTPIGRVLIEGNRNAITRVEIVPADAPVGRSNRVLASARKQLREYFKGRRTAFSIPLDGAAGTHFQRAVWRELQAIPIGQTITYHELARRVTKAREGVDGVIFHRRHAEKQSSFILWVSVSQR